MKIELAQHSGFCMGVRDAVLKIVKELDASDEEIYVYGPLIHNAQTVRILEKRGLKTIKNLDRIDNKIIAIRTHGIPVENLRDIKKRSGRYINLTCPRVSRVQGIIKKYSGKGYYTIIVGDAEHAEVMSLKSYAASGVSVVSSVDDIASVPSHERYLVVSQTTQDKTNFQNISNRLNESLRNVTVFNTICDSTNNRQNDIKNAISHDIDLLVVVGGRHSANTTRLAQLGLECGIRTIHIESEEELNPGDFINVNNVLVTAGASTPGWIINNVMERLFSIKYTTGNVIGGAALRFIEHLLRLNLLSAVSAFFLTMFSQLYSSGSYSLIPSVISAIYILAMYTINNNMEIESLISRNPMKYALQHRYQKFLIPISTIMLVFSLLLAARYGYVVFLVYLLSTLLGVIYSTTFIKRIIDSINFRVLTRIYYVKNFVSSFGWVISTVGIPLLINSSDALTFLALGLFVFTLIFLRDLFIDISAFQGDLLFGRQTLPTILGISGTRIVAVCMAIVTIVVFGGISIYTGRLPYLVFTLNILYFIFLYAMIQIRQYSIAIKHEMLIDLNFVLFIAILFVLKYLPVTAPIA